MCNLGAFEALHAVAQLVDLSRDRCQRFRERIVNLFRVSNHNSFAVAEDDMTRNADHCRILRHTSQHDRTRADPAVPPNRNVAENFRPIANYRVVFDRGVPLAALLTSTTERDALIQSHIVANDRGFADDHPKPMIDEQSPANLGSRMDFDSRQESRYLREPSRQKQKTVIP